jgi:hypothetical protein
MPMTRHPWRRGFWGELIACFPLIRHAPHRKRLVQQLFYCCVCIRCHRNVFTDPLPNMVRGYTDTEHGDLISLLFFQNREGRLQTFGLAYSCSNMSAAVAYQWSSPLCFGCYTSVRPECPSEGQEVEVHCSAQSERLR